MNTATVFLSPGQLTNCTKGFELFRNLGQTSTLRVIVMVCLGGGRGGSGHRECPLGLRKS